MKMKIHDVSVKDEYCYLVVVVLLTVCFTIHEWRATDCLNYNIDIHRSKYDVSQSIMVTYS